jgi:tRNA threonylcarbamoyladenosine biosynthesis protein TsaE
MEIIVNNLRQTNRFAKKFAKSLKGGEKILLNGDLGAGKTTFTKYLAEALKVKDEVTSPSFTILRQYEGKFKLNHFDLYRIEDISELQELGFDEFLDNKPDTILLIEWGERAKLNQQEFVNITIEKLDENKRKIRVE